MREDGIYKIGRMKFYYITLFSYNNYPSETISVNHSHFCYKITIYFRGLEGWINLTQGVSACPANFTLRIRKISLSEIRRPKGSNNFKFVNMYFLIGLQKPLV